MNYELHPSNIKVLMGIDYD